MSKVLIVATSRKTRGGITSVIKAHETGEQWKKFHCRWIETHRDGNNIYKIWYFFTAIARFVFLVPFCDIVHVHTANNASPKRKAVFVKIAKLLHKKVIVHLHLGDEKYLLSQDLNKPLEKLFDVADKVIVLSPQWKRWLLVAFPDKNYDIEVLYNPCPIVKRNDKVIKEKYILYAGTILKRKGYDVLLKGFGRIAKKYPDWKVKLAGNPYLLEGINEVEDGKRIAYELGMSNQVEWLGWVSGEKKDEVFQKASIYCLASESEGFPMGVLDAWAYGLPCVMTPVGGIPDIVSDGVNGLIFPVGNDEILAKQLEQIICSEELRANIVIETDKLVNSIFDINNICANLSRIYSSLC